MDDFWERDMMLDRFGIDAKRAGGERFLVTGSEGCIGAWTVRNLATAGCVVVAVDLPPAGRRLHKILQPELHSSVIHADADIRDPDALSLLLREHRITRVIHLAALQVPFVQADPILGAEVNVTGTLRLLEAVRSADGQVRGASYASSTGAVGPAGAEHEPLTLYGAFKLCNEHSARLYARDFATYALGLRPCVVYGPGRDQGLTAALTHALKAAVLGVPYEIPFGGYVDAQYAEDVANAFIAAALLDDDGPVKVYDLHGDCVSVSDYLALIAKIIPGSEQLLTFQDSPIPGNVDVDDGDLVKRLGRLPKTSLEQGMRLSVEAFRHHLGVGLLGPDEIPARVA